MTDLNLQPAEAKRTTKRADQLVVGDRIDRRHLPVFDEDAAVVFVRTYAEPGGERWAFVAFAYDSGYHDSTAFRPDAAITVTPAPTPPGFEYAREHGPEDGELTQPGRIPPHFEDGRAAGEVPPTDPGDLPGEQVNAPCRPGFDPARDTVCSPCACVLGNVPASES